MKIRLATSSDRTPVLLLLNQLGEVMNGKVHYDPDNTRAHELGNDNYIAAMKRDDRKIFVVENNGSLIGVATFFILHDFMTGQPFAHIDDFIIDKHHRGRGIGTQLLEYVKLYAKHNHIHVIKLTSSNTLTEAHAFYEKCGGVIAQKVIKFIL